MATTQLIIRMDEAVKANLAKLAKALKLLLRVGEIALGYPVEIEFAVNFNKNESQPAELTILQIRSMIPPDKYHDVNIENIDVNKVLFYSENALGNGVIRGIKDIIYIKSESFQMSNSTRAVSQIRKLNTKLMEENKPYMLEWYRVEWDHHQLMNEISQLLSDLLSPYIDLAESCFVTYQAAFQDVLGINPHNVSKDDLIACTEKAGLGNVLDKEEHRDRFLELLFSHKIEPVLGKEGGIKRGIKEEKNTDKPCICFLYNYPASQAALAKTVLESGHLIAERFEVFINGMELGNGFHELNDSAEQKARFEADNRFRKALEKVAIPMDERFLAALDYLPECAGVALGIERLLMVMSRSQDISEVIAFPFDRA